MLIYCIVYFHDRDQNIILLFILTAYILVIFIGTSKVAALINKLLYSITLYAVIINVFSLLLDIWSRRDTVYTRLNSILFITKIHKTNMFLTLNL